jgi:hypothetical protein
MVLETCPSAWFGENMVNMENIEEPESANFLHLTQNPPHGGCCRQKKNPGGLAMYARKKTEDVPLAELVLREKRNRGNSFSTMKYLADR